MGAATLCCILEQRKKHMHSGGSTPIGKFNMTARVFGNEIDL
jgi:hypothetical protein